MTVEEGQALTEREDESHETLASSELIGDSTSASGNMSYNGRNGLNGGSRDGGG